jgi:hypothetical protein
MVPGQNGLEVNQEKINDENEEVERHRRAQTGMPEVIALVV